MSAALTARAVLTTALVAGLLLSGCTGGEEPLDVARTDGTPASPSRAVGTGATVEEEPQAALVLGGAFGSTVPGCSPRRTYLAAYQSVEVTREVRLGEPVVQGGGRLVGEAFLLPAPRRGPDDQGLSILTDRPTLRLGRASEGWDQRVPVAGQAVMPGEYALFLQVEARPGHAVKGVFFDWSGSGATGSDLFELELRYSGRCRG